VPRPDRTLIRHTLTLPSWTIAVSAIVAVTARLPFMGHAASPDEGGFLVVGGQWNGAGSSLYGNYWVDRPPLLVTIFRLASSLGGLTALRLIGCVAAALVVIGSAKVAGMLGGCQAARWAGVTAAGLCLNPLMGRYEVNGELLTAPFILAGVACVIRAVRSTGQRDAIVASALAGACAMSSILIKQNMADVAVFGVVAFTVSLRRGDITRRRFGMLSFATAGGALGAASVLALWTVVHGTSLAGVYDAAYPFRIRADQAQAAGGGSHSTARFYGLAAAAVISGLGLLIVWLARDVVLRRRRDAAWWALVGTTLFAVVSVLLGGNYWHHYLIELVAPVSIATGVIAARRGFMARSLIVYVAVVASIGWAVNLALPQGSDGQAVGRAIAASAQPSDTIVTTWGHADLTFASGLSSPYSELWSLPVKTNDPQLNQLDTVLTGPTAPTWFVTWGHLPSWGLDTANTDAILAQDYHVTGQICGRTVYLRNGVDRPAPSTVSRCHGATTPLSTMKELAS
jgi:hypothetical protein